MNQEQMENTMQFLLENQAKLHSDLVLLLENVQGIATNQRRTDVQIQALAERVDDVVGAVDVIRGELREAFDNLILTNEVTRELTVQIGSLVVQTSQRLTKLEERNGHK
jgi:hypothetical protein